MTKTEIRSSAALAGDSGQGWGARLWRSIVIATWFALAGGLVGGAKFLLFQRYGWLNWSAQSIPIDESILWASPATNLVLFVLMAFLMWAALGWIRRLPWDALTISLYAAVLTYLYIIQSGHLLRPATAMLAIGVGSQAYRWVRRAPQRRVRFFVSSVPWVLGIAATIWFSVVPGQAMWERYKFSQLQTLPPEAPNVLLIVLDTVRADRFSIYGYS
ncbi:MAG TPA: hypothetical protein VFV78_03220, partial [Vicinamibacterales bacterium]|nr:hypothetical protein [Vicinamibacterales bacterium]